MKFSSQVVVAVVCFVTTTANIFVSASPMSIEVVEKGDLIQIENDSYELYPDNKIVGGGSPFTIPRALSHSCKGDDVKVNIKDIGKKTCARIKELSLCNDKVKNKDGDTAVEFCNSCGCGGFPTIPPTLSCKGADDKVNIKNKGKKTCARIKELSLCNDKVKNKDGDTAVKFCTSCGCGGGGGDPSDDGEFPELNPNNRIVGGNPSENGEFPYYVLMLDGANSNAFGFCGGSLIAPRVVLTAAHCQPEKNIGNFITVGPTDRYSLDNGGFQQAKNIKSKDAVPHPNYNSGTQNNDFALVLLKEEYIMETMIQLVLNKDSDFPPAGDELDVLGMGTKSSNGSLASVLRDVKVDSFSNSQCNSYLGGNPIKQSMLCAGLEGGGKDSCQGDSGGPLVKIDENTHTQVGVVSWGYGCADMNSPGVYSRVSEQIDWMQDQICDKWNVESSLCGPPAPPAPTDAPAPTPRPTPRPTSVPDPAFKNLGIGFCRDSNGNYNEPNWEASFYCVDLPTCQEKCKNQDECLGVAWASDPSTDDDGCNSNSLPRCVVYYSEEAPAVAITQVSGSPGEYTAYLYIPVDPTPAPVDPTPVPVDPTPVPVDPTPAPMTSDPAFENLGLGFCRDSAGIYNEDNWEVNYHCVDLPTCRDKCKDQDNCVGIAWASEPPPLTGYENGIYLNGCREQSLPRCIVYYGETAPPVEVEDSSDTPEEYTAYRYCGDNSVFRWKNKAKKNCGWVARKLSKIKNLCNKKAYRGASETIRDYCKETCGQC